MFVDGSNANEPHHKPSLNTIAENLDIESEGTLVNHENNYGTGNPPATQSLRKIGPGSASLTLRMDVLRGGVRIRSTARELRVQPSTIRYWRKKLKNWTCQHSKNNKKTLHKG
jgi:hypothetical protein